MTIVFDIGNTNITAAVFDGGNIILRFIMPVVSSGVSGPLIKKILREASINPGGLDGAVIGSVVPAMTKKAAGMLKKSFKLAPVLFTPSTKMNVRNMYKNKKEVGDDRLANAAGAVMLYGRRDMVIVDFGTAITFDVVDRRARYLGGVIMPGIKLSLKALYEGTARLPAISMDYPRRIIGDNTAEAMQSGVKNSAIAAVKFIVEEIRKELGAKTLKIIFTGGDADIRLAHASLKKRVIMDRDLTLKGLKHIYDLNRGKRV
ncbi:MAG TPA: type III pantothenate kinase [bacterium]|nr:type III pantothenate kinase [bacterium]